MRKSKLIKPLSLILLFTILVIGALLGVSSIGTKIAAQFTPLIDASMVIKYRTSRFHLAVEEVVNAAPGATRQKAWKQFTVAKKYAKAMIDGGETPEGVIIPLEDEQLRILVVDVYHRLESLEIEATKRLQTSDKTAPTFAPYSHFHQEFDSVLAIADELEEELYGVIEKRLNEFHGLMLTIVLGVLIFASAVAYAIYMYERDRNDTERQLELAKEKAEEANQAKSEFLAAMSHDLRTPLNAIMGFSEMMSSNVLGPVGNPDYESYAKDIHVSGRLLLSLINGILDLSKIEAGKYKLDDQLIELPSFIDTCLHLINKQAHEKQIIIRAEQHPQLPQLRADHRAMGQILNNLISNALKFTNNGGSITISTLLRDTGYLSIKVTDTGIGMSPKEIRQALKPFEQINSQIARKHEGTGLGLYISSNLINLHGGSMDIESEPDKGTIVIITFPPERVVHDDEMAIAGV